MGMRYPSIPINEAMHHMMNRLFFRISKPKLCFIVSSLLFLCAERKTGRYVNTIKMVIQFNPARKKKVADNPCFLIIKSVIIGIKTTKIAPIKLIKPVAKDRRLLK